MMQLSLQAVNLLRDHHASLSSGVHAHAGQRLDGSGKSTGERDTKESYSEKHRHERPLSIGVEGGSGTGRSVSA